MLKIHGARMIGNSCLVLLSIFEPKQREPLPCEKFPNAPDPSYLSVCNIILFLVLICLRICDLSEEIFKKNPYECFIPYRGARIFERNKLRDTVLHVTTPSDTQ